MTNEEMMKKHGILPPVDIDNIGSNNAEIRAALHRVSRILLQASKLMAASEDAETREKGIEAAGASEIAEGWIKHIKDDPK